MTTGGRVHSDVEALLALQADDEVIRRIEHRLAAIAPQLAALKRAREAAETTLAHARATLAAEEITHREIHGRLEEHRQLQARSATQMEHVKKAKEASAAMIQMQQVDRFVAQDSSELASSVSRLASLRSDIAEHEMALEEIDESQAAEQRRLDEERLAIEADLEAARAKRDAASQRVPRAVLAKYDRIRRNRGGEAAIYPLRGSSCGNCDTSLPLQRRSVMATTGTIELCEACGVLLYAAD